VERLKI
jgi:Ca2+-binding EF-hand superfamily protein